MKSKFLLNSVTLLSLIIVSPLLTSCSGLMPPSAEKRYQHINSMLDKLDYESAGGIAKQSKDRGDGVFNTSYIAVEYDDAESFDTLTKRAEELGLDCVASTATQASCKDGAIEVSVKRESPGSKVVVLRVFDRTNGRK